MLEAPTSTEKIVIKERSGNVLRVEVIGETHTFGNMLAKELQSREDVELAYYVVKHPLIERFELLLRTKPGKDPMEVLVEAMGGLVSKLERLESLIAEGLRGR
ncbi:MAG: DNA-directed RNA polymerase subunit L [Fervidicoccaceae archaeon]